MYVAWEVKERDTQTGNVRGLGGQRKGHANRECTWPGRSKKGTRKPGMYVAWEVKERDTQTGNVRGLILVCKGVTREKCCKAGTHSR